MTCIRERLCQHCPFRASQGPDEGAEDVRDFVQQGLMSVDEALTQCGWDERGVRCRGSLEFFGSND